MKTEFPLSKLEKKLSLNQGLGILTNHQILPSQLDLSHSQYINHKKRKQYLHDVKVDTVLQCFESIHQKLFFDTHGFDEGLLQPGIRQCEVALRYRTFNRLAELLYDNSGKLRHFPANKDFINHTLVPVLAATYKDLITLLPVSYGNHITAQVFTTYIAQTLIGKSSALDFSQITDPQDIEILANPSSTLESIITVFVKAIPSPEQKKVPQHKETSQPKEWQPIPDGCFTFSPESTEVYHKLTLYTSGNHKAQEFILAFDGGLIPLKAAQEYFDAHKTLDGFTLQRSKIDHYLREEWRTREFLDGIPLGNSTQPFRVDVDYLTGLTKSESTLLETCLTRIKSVNPEFKKSYRDVTDLPKFKDSLYGLCENQREWSVIEKACERLQYTVPVLLQKVHTQLSTATTSETPNYYVTVGGSGAGKGTLIGLAKKECSDNMVVASLDDARTYFDVWQYGIGHGSDYPHLSTAATLVRTKILDGALAQKKSVIKDCAGIPYEREKTGLDKAKMLGFSTHALVTTAPIPASMKRSYLRLYNENDTVREDGRGLPPSILVKKHIGVSQEITHYIHDTDLNRMVIFDNCQSRKECFILAQNHTVSLETLQKFTQAKTEGKLTETLKENDLLPSDPDFKHPKGYENVDTNFLIVAKNETSATVTLIYDEERFIGFIGKALQNPQAKNPEELKENCLPHHVPKLLGKAKEFVPSSLHLLSHNRPSYLETLLTNTEPDCNKTLPLRTV